MNKFYRVAYNRFAVLAKKNKTMSFFFFFLRQAIVSDLIASGMGGGLVGWVDRRTSGGRLMNTLIVLTFGFFVVVVVHC